MTAKPGTDDPHPTNLEEEDPVERLNNLDWPHILSHVPPGPPGRRICLTSLLRRLNDPEPDATNVHQDEDDRTF